MPIKYRQRKTFDAFRWTGDRTALRAWIASLPVPIEIHDCGPAGDAHAGPDVLFNWTTVPADPKVPFDQPERVFGNRIERGQWIVQKEVAVWGREGQLAGISCTDEEFRDLFEEVVPNLEAVARFKSTDAPK